MASNNSILNGVFFCFQIKYHQEWNDIKAIYTLTDTPRLQAVKNAARILNEVCTFLPGTIVNRKFGIILYLWIMNPGGIASEKLQSRKIRILMYRPLVGSFPLSGLILREFHSILLFQSFSHYWPWKKFTYHYWSTVLSLDYFGSFHLYIPLFFLSFFMKLFVYSHMFILTSGFLVI